MQLVTKTQSMKEEEKQKKSILDNCKKLFNPATDEWTTIPESEYKGYMDASCVAMIIPKNTHIKRLLELHFDVKERNIPILSFVADEKEEIKSKYSGHYLKVFLAMATHYENVVVSTRKDFPLRVECDDFIFILAPEVDTD